MAGSSIYEVDNAQDIAKKPPDKIVPDDYRDDVFFMTRPEVIDFDDKLKDRNPYYQVRDDFEIQDKEINEFTNVHAPQNWNDQKPQLKNPYKKYTSIQEVISEYRLEHNPIIFTMDTSPQSNIKTAKPLELLLKSTSEFSHANAGGCSVRRIRYIPEQRYWTYRVVSNTPGHNPAGHLVKVRLGKDPEEKDIRKLEIKVSCSCPFWLYWGPDWNSYHEGYLEGRPLSKLWLRGKGKTKGRIRREKGPFEKNLICKHVFAVGELFSSFAYKHHLDTFKEVDQIVDLLDKETDVVSNEEMLDIEEISNLLSGTEKVGIQRLLSQYEKEKNPNRRLKIRQKAIAEVERILERKEKGFLKNLYRDIVNKSKLNAPKITQKIVDVLEGRKDDQAIKALDKVVLNKLPEKDKKEVQSIIDSYGAALDPTERKRLSDKAIYTVQKSLKTKDKSLLDNLLDSILKFLNIKKSSSVDSIITGYIEEILR